MLAYSRVKEYPAGLELPIGARIVRKASVKIRRNPQLLNSSLDPNILYLHKYVV